MVPFAASSFVVFTPVLLSTAAKASAVSGINSFPFTRYAPPSYNFNIFILLKVLSFIEKNIQNIVYLFLGVNASKSILTSTIFSPLPAISLL